MKKLLVLAFMATIFFACSQQEEIVDNVNAGKTSLSVRIDLSRFNTRSGDGLVSTPLPTWSYLLLVAKNTGGTEVREILIAKADFTGTVQVFEKEPVNFSGGTVEAYIVTENNDWGTITALNTPNLPVLATEQTDINNWQPSGLIKTGITGKFVNIPYYGSGTIVDNGPGGDGHHQLACSVTVVPELGRIQILNTPQTGGTLNSNTVTSIVVNNIYINKITGNGSTVDIRTQNGGTSVETAGKWITDFYAATKPLAGMTDVGTDKGYQIFNGNTPHLIVEVQYQLNGVTTKDYTGYLTITKFTYNTVDKGDLTVAKGKIYNIDLSQLQPAYDKIGDDPYDETTYYDLNVVVTVADWSEIAVKPEL
ncbi:hypothetical protein [Bacteroides sp.]|uniref:hypothetical protein n=1 Tax=Bacteroides sp. TaxID=29523 RepID=UPI0026369B77|nr:hypothetical protein [Bacteroides sp.]